MKESVPWRFLTVCSRRRSKYTLKELLTRFPLRKTRTVNLFFIKDPDKQTGERKSKMNHYEENALKYRLTVVLTSKLTDAADI
jgi:hypothetical protein